jgi:hypothetical protein
MHPSLLHQLADDTVARRRRTHPHRYHQTRRPGLGTRAWARTRVGVGGLLINVGTRLAGSRPGPAALQGHTSASS